MSLLVNQMLTTLQRIWLFYLLVQDTIADKNRTVKYTEWTAIHACHCSSRLFHNLVYVAIKYNQMWVYAEVHDKLCTWEYAAIHQGGRKQKKLYTRTPAAISQGLRRNSQYASTIPSATWHMSTAAAPNRLTPCTTWFPRVRITWRALY